MSERHFRAYYAVSRQNAMRTHLVMDQIGQRARAHHDDDLVALTARGAEAANRVIEVEEAYRLQTNARGDGEATRVDSLMDNAIEGACDALYNGLRYFRQIHDPIADRLDSFCRLHFDGNVATITRVPFEIELGKVERLYAALTGPYADFVERLSLQLWVALIGQHLPPYRAALAARSRVTGGDLRSARQRMHELTCAVVGHVTSRYLDAPDVIAELLAPLDDQQQRIAAIMRARRAGVRTGAMEDPADAAGDVSDTDADAAEAAAEAEEAALDAAAEAEAAAAAPPSGTARAGGAAPAGASSGAKPGDDDMQRVEIPGPAPTLAPPSASPSRQ